MMGSAAAVHVEQCVSVAAPLQNQDVDRMLAHARRLSGQTIVCGGGFMM